MYANITTLFFKKNGVFLIFPQKKQRRQRFHKHFRLIIIYVLLYFAFGLLLLFCGYLMYPQL